MPLDRPLVIGRSPACELRLDDPSVSRVHARIEADEDSASIEDIGSTYGTFVDGRRLEGRCALVAGTLIELGDCRLEVAERDDPAAANRTVSVPAGISLVIDRPVVRRTRLAGHSAHKPRLRSGWSLKRLEAAEGEDRWVLKDHRSSAFVRLLTLRPSSSSCSTASMSSSISWGRRPVRPVPTARVGWRACSPNWPTAACCSASRVRPSRRPGCRG